MDYSELKKALAQAQDRFKMAAPDTVGPHLPEEGTPEEMAVADSGLGMAMGTVQAPKAAMALREPMAEKQLAQAFERQKLQREYDFAKRNAEALAERTGKSAAEVPFPEMPPRDLISHLRNNPDIATAIKSVATKPNGLANVEKLAGADGKFQALKDFLARKK